MAQFTESEALRPEHSFPSRGPTNEQLWAACTKLQAQKCKVTIAAVQASCGGDDSRVAGYIDVFVQHHKDQTGTSTDLDARIAKDWEIARLRREIEDRSEEIQKLLEVARSMVEIPVSINAGAGTLTRRKNNREAGHATMRMALFELYGRRFSFCDESDAYRVKVELNGTTVFDDSLYCYIWADETEDRIDFGWHFSEVPNFARDHGISSSASSLHQEIGFSKEGMLLVIGKATGNGSPYAIYIDCMPTLRQAEDDDDIAE
jgi:hypothetical protein